MLLTQSGPLWAQVWDEVWCWVGRGAPGVCGREGEEGGSRTRGGRAERWVDGSAGGSMGGTRLVGPVRRGEGTELQGLRAREGGCPGLALRE